MLHKLTSLGFAIILFVASWSHAQEALDNGPFDAAVAAAQKRVVKIYGATIGRTPGYATGIIISPDGQIVTANGVYLGEGSVRVTMPDGSQQQGEVVRRSQSLQTALLKVNVQTPDYFALPDQPAAKKGDWVLAVSNAFKVADGAEPLSVNIGVLSLRVRLDARRGYNDFPYEDDVFLIDAITSNPGAAGGAVVNAQGDLVGLIGKVIEGKTTGTRLNYAVPADLLVKFIRGEEAPPMVTVTPAGQKGELGIRLFALGGRKSPAYIDRVISGSPAAEAGLKTDDLVVSINGEVVRDSGDYRRLSENVIAGVEVIIEVKRKNDLLSIHLKPTPLKAGIPSLNLP
ncbi:S1C family serine protease [Anatilimnocola sp. NA78]|uniref:S1C family serine protease n=1 Tax=Anatilimnocola sp. NA78 TaxID=3415683 RepID=UPI003CE4575E